jgi:hypothetical protein
LGTQASSSLDFIQCYNTSTPSIIGVPNISLVYIQDERPSIGSPPPLFDDKQTQWQIPDLSAFDAWMATVGGTDANATWTLFLRDVELLSFHMQMTVQDPSYGSVSWTT